MYVYINIYIYIYVYIYTYICSVTCAYVCDLEHNDIFIYTALHGTCCLQDEEAMDRVMWNPIVRPPNHSEFGSGEKWMSIRLNHTYKGGKNRIFHKGWKNISSTGFWTYDKNRIRFWRKITRLFSSGVDFHT